MSEDLKNKRKYLYRIVSAAIKPAYAGHGSRKRSMSISSGMNSNGMNRTFRATANNAKTYQSRNFS